MKLSIIRCLLSNVYGRNQKSINNFLASFALKSKYSSHPLEHFHWCWPSLVSPQGLFSPHALLSPLEIAFHRETSGACARTRLWNLIMQSRGFTQYQSLKTHVTGVTLFHKCLTFRVPLETVYLPPNNFGGLLSTCSRLTFMHLYLNIVTSAESLQHVIDGLKNEATATCYCPIKVDSAWHSFADLTADDISVQDFESIPHGEAGRASFLQAIEWWKYGWIFEDVHFHHVSMLAAWVICGYCSRLCGVNALRLLCSAPLKTVEILRVWWNQWKIWLLFNPSKSAVHRGIISKFPGNQYSKPPTRFGCYLSTIWKKQSREAGVKRK